MPSTIKGRGFRPARLAGRGSDRRAAKGNASISATRDRRRQAATGTLPVVP